MSDDNPAAPSPTVPPRNFSPLAAFLSYLVPGLGQITQGRVGKGVLFMVCLVGMWFYGMDLGSWCNVYAPDTTPQDRLFTISYGGKPLFQFESTILGSLWKRPSFAAQFWIGANAWPAIAQYDGIWPFGDKDSFLHNYQRERSEDYINELQRNGDKSWDLGLVCTVIAGVLNILVIYDAYAGPAFHGEAEPSPAQREEAAVA